MDQLVSEPAQAVWFFQYCLPELPSPEGGRTTSYLRQKVDELPAQVEQAVRCSKILLVVFGPKTGSELQ